MKSTITRRAVVVSGRKTSISLETPFWETLYGIAATRGTTVSALISKINEERAKTNLYSLSSALRLFVLNECQRCVASADERRPCWRH